MSCIEVFADITCPFTHVGLRRLVAMRDSSGRSVDLRVRAWPLEWINGAPLTAELVSEEIEALRSSVVPDLFVGFDASSFPATSLPAFGLAAAAYAVNHAVGETVSLAIRDALFEQGHDVSDPDVIAHIGAQHDVVPFGADATAAAVNADWQRGRARGVKGSPHFIVGDRDWFCPSLQVRHDASGFSVEEAEEATREFLASALA